MLVRASGLPDTAAAAAMAKLSEGLCTSAHPWLRLALKRSARALRREQATCLGRHGSGPSGGCLSNGSVQACAWMHFNKRSACRFRSFWNKGCVTLAISCSLCAHCSPRMRIVRGALAKATSTACIVVANSRSSERCELAADGTTVTAVAAVASAAPVASLAAIARDSAIDHGGELPCDLVPDARMPKPLHFASSSVLPLNN